METVSLQYDRRPSQKKQSERASMCYRRFEAIWFLHTHCGRGMVLQVAKNITGDCVIFKIVSCKNLAIFPNVSVTCKKKIHSGVPRHSNFEFSVH